MSRSPSALDGASTDLGPDLGPETGASISPHPLEAFDLDAIRLLLRGESVVDWHRLSITTLEASRRLFSVNRIDLDNPADLERIETRRRQAVAYIQTVLGLRIDAAVAESVPVLELPLLASGKGKSRRHACILLKVMHIIHHLDARELLTDLPIPDSVLFDAVERSVTEMFDGLRAAGVPVAEFAWSRKTRESLVTKLLVKPETSAARVFDRLRFRLVVEHPTDLIPTLRVLLRECIPFNYIVPLQTNNNLIDPASLADPRSPHDRSIEPDEQSDGSPQNEFSADDYRALNFVADLPVRVETVLKPEDLRLIEGRGRIVFVLAEFQIMDAATAKANAEGANAHELYKQRQHHRVRERLMKAPSQRHGDVSERTTTSNTPST